MRVQLLFPAILVLAAASPTFALDIGASFSLGNLGFATDRLITDTAFPGTASFLGPYLWGLNLSAAQPLSDNLRFEAGFIVDPVLRNLSYTLISYTEKIITVGVGPFFGFFNLLPDGRGVLLKPGITTEVKVELPGIAFVRFRSDSSIGGQLVSPGSYLQERGDVGIGFYVPNAICSLNLETRSFTQMLDTYQVVDSITEYSLRTQIFQKNVPYRILLSLGYLTQSRTYLDTPSVVHALNSIVGEGTLDFPVAPYLTLSATFTGSIYDFSGVAPLATAVKPAFLFNSTVGMKLNIDSIGAISRVF
jgi:hypothetical protein